MFLKNGQIVNIEAPFTGVDGIQYPANFLVGAAPETLADFNIVEIEDPIALDEKYYYNSLNADGTYISTPKSKEQILGPIKSAIKAKRNYLTSTGGYQVGDNWYHSDNISRAQQTGLALLGANLPQVEWKTMAGTYVTMTPELALEILSAATKSDIAIFKVAKNHIDTLEAINEDPLAINEETAEEMITRISAYDWEADWPETFKLL